MYLSFFFFPPSSQSDQVLHGGQREIAVFFWPWHTLYAVKPNIYLFKILMQMTEHCLADKRVHRRLSVHIVFSFSRSLTQGPCWKEKYTGE